MDLLVDSHVHVIAAEQDRYPLGPASIASVPGVPGG
jgi:hypothetical protein